MRNRIDVDRLTVVIDRGIRERCAMLWPKRQTVQQKSCRLDVLRHLRRRDGRRRTTARSAVRHETRTATDAEELHRDLFNVRAVFRQLVRAEGGEVFTPVELIVLFVTNRAAGGDGTRQTTVHETARAIRREIERRV